MKGDTASVATGDMPPGEIAVCFCWLPAVSVWGKSVHTVREDFSWLSAVVPLSCRASRCLGVSCGNQHGILGTSKRENWKPYQWEQPRLRGGQLPLEPLGPGSLQSLKSRNGCLTACGCYLTAAHSTLQGEKSVKNSSPLLQGRALHLFRGQAEGRGSWGAEFFQLPHWEGTRTKPSLSRFTFPSSFMPDGRNLRITGWSWLCPHPPPGRSLDDAGREG